MTIAEAPIELPLPESSHKDSTFVRFSNLRGVRWRIDLGILPSNPEASIDELRRVAADSRRRYVKIRRRLLIDPHLLKDGSKSPNLAMDNPLSQSPDSTWGRFFRNAELERVVDQDLSRLYPEHENYFRTPACQALLRRILLLWCLKHPEYGYGQGMHELLAPLLYVLHVDLLYLSQVKARYEDCFSDDYDEMSLPESDIASNYRFTKSTNVNSKSDNDGLNEARNPKVTTLDDLDPETKEIFLLSNAYGAEGELGVILSERFMEHDAYCIFDGLMSGAHGVVAMADFFSPSPVVGSSTGFPPVIEASSTLYHLLSLVDSSLHNHLIELGVEPQYFALRWLRVLFGREFSLDDLLLIWDELFSSSNTSIIENEVDYNFKILCCPRGAFISAMAVSMLIQLRSSLLATENATTALQRLLNFPEKINVRRLIEKAKSWQALALEANILPNASHNSLKPAVSRMHSLPTDSSSPKTPQQPLPDSYWEERWRVLHKEVSDQKNGGGSSSSGKIKKSLGERVGLPTTASDSSSVKKAVEKDARRKLLGDVKNKLEPNDVQELLKENISSLPVPIDRTSTGRISNSTADEACLSVEDSLVISITNSPHSTSNDHDNDSEKGSAISSSFVAENDEEANQVEEIGDVESTVCAMDTNSTYINEVGHSKEAEMKRKLLSGKFQWLLRFRRSSGEGNFEKGLSNSENVVKEITGDSTLDCNSFGDSERMELGDKKGIGTMKNIGQSMLENIQVIESVFQQDRSKGHATAMAALKELRKISNLLTEM